MERLRPSAPSFEVKRQHALRRYQILDTPPEESFDRITRLATQLFTVPIALITLVDDDRQWHKSCFGLDIREVDRSVSFCAHNLDGDTVMVVEDATDDDRFADNPLVTGPPHIRFYAGAPLITPDDYTLGSLCIIDREPRPFGDDQQAQLCDLAAMVTDELRLRREVAARRQWETVQSGQNAILEQIASGSPLEEVLDTTTRFVESLFDEARASLSLLNQENNTLHVGAAPHLPADFLDVVEGAPVDSELGTCVWAAHHDTDVTTHDIATDMHWENARDLALAHDLRTCWSTPIHGEGGAVLGTLALYYPTSRMPSRADQQFVRLGAYLAGLAIERDHAQEALRKSETKFRSLVERTTDWVWEIDAAGRFTYVSPAAEDIIGYPPDDLLGKTTFDVMTPADARAFEQALAPYLTAQTSFDRLEKTVQHRDGNAVVLETSGVPRFDVNDQFVGYRGIARNVTDRRAAQDALQDSEERFRGLVSNLPGLVYRCTYDEAWTTLYMSRGLDEIAGYAVEAFERDKRSFKEIMYPGDLEQVLDAVREAVDTQSYFEVEYRVCTPDGRIRWIEDIGRPCFDEDGRVQWLDGVMFDVTERKRTEQRLRLLETAVNDATESVLITDSALDEPGPRIVYANPGFEAMTGYQPDAVLGKTPRLLQGPETDASLLIELRALLERGESFFGETINYRKDGTPFVNEWSISPVYDDREAVTHYVAVQRDITERKRMEEQLLQIRAAVENMSSAVSIADADGQLLYLNAAGEQLLGYTVPDLNEAGGLAALFADPQRGEATLDTLGTGTPWRGEAEIVSRTERVFPALVHTDAVVDESGAIVGMVASIDDMSERRRIENELARYFDVTLDMLCFCTREGIIQRVNRQFTETLGYPEAEALQERNFNEFLHPDDRAATAMVMAHLDDGQQVTDFVNRWRHHDGSYRMMEWRAVQNEEGIIYAAARDVTDRERAKKELIRYAQQLEDTTDALEDAKARTDRILASITDAFFALDHEWRFTYLNQQAEDLLQRGRDTLLGENVWSAFPEARDTVFQTSYERAVRENEAVQFETFYPAHGRWYRVHAYPFEDGLSVFFSDVTDRKHAERALRASEQKYRTVVDNVRDVVFRTDAKGRLMFLNPAWTDVTGYSIQESLGKSLGSFMLSSEQGDGAMAFDAMLGNERDFFRSEVQLKTQEAEPRWMEVFARPVFDEEGQIVSTSGTLHDVTKWREAEQQMRTALEKERELGRLKSRFVSMASHELRTPLATIQSSAELAALFMERGIEAKSTKHLHRIENNVERMATLLEDVLVFGRVESGRLPFDPQPMDLSTLAREAVANIQQGIGQSHAIRTTGLDDTHSIEADPQLVRLVLTNLLSNAVKYSAAGSVVRLAVDRDDEHVHITVEDEGIGIPDADLHRLFEPFHRAENVGTRRGTGLGLAILKEVADLHEGEVGVNSAEGEGSTFWVTLPLQSSFDAAADA